MNPLDETKRASALPRYDFLDGLRALLALYVVLHHGWYTVNLHNPAQLSPHFGVFAYGGLSVCFFIILSGFCLVLPFLRRDFDLARDLGTFLRRRAWRIIPPYYLALAVSLVLIFLLIPANTGTTWDNALPVTTHNLLTHFLLVHNFFPDDFYKLNYVFWSIAVEWQIYFIFPLLILSWRWMGRLTTTCAAIVVSYLLEETATSALGIVPHLHFIGLFAMGMLAAFIGSGSDTAALRYRALPWGWMAVIALPVFFTVNHFHFLLEGDVLFGVFATALLVYVSVHPEAWLRRALDFKPLVFVGSFSYSLYLIHAPLVQILWQYPFASLQSRPNLMCAALLVIGTPLMVITSYLFFLCFERPFLRKKGPPVVHVE